MTAVFYELLEFFGITYAPATFADLIPWMLSVVLGFGLVMFMFGYIGFAIRSINGGKK